MEDQNQQQIQQMQQMQQMQKSSQPGGDGQDGKKGGKIVPFAVGLLIGAAVAGLLAMIFILLQSKTTVAYKDGDSAINSATISKLQKLEEGIDAYYLNDVSQNDLEDSLYHGLVEGLGDPYSTYYSPEELEDIMESTEGIYYGIGAYIGYDTTRDYCKISKCMDNSPAKEAGLMPDDIIVKVDGQDMYKVQTSDIVTYIKGPEHTSVELTIYREGELDYLTINVERRKIETPTVAYNMDDDKIAYIQIAEFDEVTSGQFENYLSEAYQEGMKGLVIDLRDNPGGSLSTVVEIANQILPKGLVVYTEDRDGNRKEYSCDGSHEIQVPLVVLVNGNSASASEILAGAVKDYGVGTILGTTTFGKGIVQKIFSLSDGSALKLTISHYYTPKGNDIHGVGIEPDEVLELDKEAYINEGVDNQLNRAKEILRQEIGINE